ncbi:MAG TPA: ankyrin repeat domain-containing protein [Chthoniobacterales bacterium]|nr:ankyrin repeat domain-containing protein [Chthoniobacterales bacterium]
MTAAEKGDAKAAEKLLKQGADPNARVPGTWLNYTPLLAAVSEGRFEVAKLLLEHGADPSLETENHDPVLVFAAHAKYEKILRLLLAHGLSIDSRSSQKMTALERLMWSSGTPPADIEMLLRLGADPNQETSDGGRLLHRAVPIRNINAIQVLLRAGADVNGRDADGKTALIVAGYHNYEGLPIVKVLVEAGADLDAQDSNGSTALLLAIGQTEKIDAYLIEHGADVNLATHEGFTPLMRAAEKGAFEIARALIDRGADGKARMKDGMTAVHFAAGHKGDDWTEPKQTTDRRNQLELISILEGKGADLKGLTKEGRSALFFAAELGYAAMVRLLIDRGLDPRSKDNKGDTPLHWVLHAPDERIEKIKLLVAAGVNTPNNDGDTPLLLAAKAMDRPACAILLQNGATVDVVNGKGETPLFLVASSFNRQDITSAAYAEIIQDLAVKTLEIDRRDAKGMSLAMWAAASNIPEALDAILKRGADIRARSADGRTCLMWAASANASRTVDLLLGRGADISEKDNNGRTAADWARAIGYGPVADKLEKRSAVK